MKLIFFIGMPGSGKTYTASHFANQFEYDFIDLDSVIEAQEQQSIAGLFDKYGENEFRAIENKCLIDIINTITQDSIIACGGGTPCFYNNLALMKNAGTVIYLKAELDWIMNNINNTPKRPLLTNESNLMPKLQILIAQRSVFYEQAHCILNAENPILTNFEEIIKECIKKH